MKSEWRVQKTPVSDGHAMYQIYRIRDVSKTDHSGNREYSDRVFDDKELALDVARIMNEAEDIYEK